VPNILPRFVLAFLGGEKLLFADAFENKTHANLKVNKQVTTADRPLLSGGFCPDIGSFILLRHMEEHVQGYESTRTQR
ncbi:MAG: hypothetical protein JRM93_06455, partial [Nitrososphaerota archaeon]